MATVRAARQRYYDDNGFSEAAYRERWVKLKLGPVRFVFPNTASRRRAIPLHDLHHIATGYATTVVGEAEISAWEFGRGCHDYWAAWVLDLIGLGGGLLLAPRRTYRAFVRGRHSTNLYQTGWSDDLLDLTIDELRGRLGLHGEPTHASWRDRLAFAGWVVGLLLPALGLPALILLSM
jgi:hypothetical protein